jgi:hypothetical protein
MGRSALILTVLMAGAGCARRTAPPAPVEPAAVNEWRAYELVPSDVPPRLVPAKAFDAVRSGMTLGELVDVVGVGNVPNGPYYSGMNTIRWACEDGRALDVRPISYKREEVIRVDGGSGGIGWMEMLQGREVTDIPVKAGAAPTRPTLKLTKSAKPGGPGQGHLFVFEGVSTAAVHRAGPEHFRLTRVSDGKFIPLDIVYERDDLNNFEKPGLRALEARVPRVRTVMSFNYQFHGIRLSLDTGARDDKGLVSEAGLLDLYGRAALEPDTRYQLKWACWQVGATEAAEMIYEFVTPK